MKYSLCFSRNLYGKIYFVQGEGKRCSTLQNDDVHWKYNYKYTRYDNTTHRSSWLFDEIPSGGLILVNNALFVEIPRILNKNTKDSIWRN